MIRELRDGGWVRFVERFVTDHEAWMTALREGLPLRQETVRVFGREHPTPRLTSWHGDPGCAYAYSGRVFEPAPWTERLTALRDRLEATCDVRFNSVLANYYRDGADAMGAHADDEPELGPSRDDVRIASISFGAPRRFVLKHRTTKETHEQLLGEGSLLVMGGTLQRHYTHRVPRTKKPVGPRLNLTFRLVLRGASARHRP
ncbi:MAG TPA: alpha-ketoglutarate-dependent dioxygenase AlkB [Sandaracinaceae bacterium LLY-WYZ-13_1]|nr:alpha-ketoglutarate-dependent dioxygenase AlkB [Sandaracinaceae bacterium LLY-WYZ-13_1]